MIKFCEYLKEEKLAEIIAKVPHSDFANWVIKKIQTKGEIITDVAGKHIMFKATPEIDPEIIRDMLVTAGKYGNRASLEIGKSIIVSGVSLTYLD